jgi:predicted deacetylase
MPDANRSLIVSFHDLHPGSRTACERFLGLAADAGVHRQSLLVVPRWHRTPPFVQDTDFVHWLRLLADNGHDICLHGNTHVADEIRGGPIARTMARFYTNREGEFYQLTRGEALSKLDDGLDLFGRAGISVHGFTAPAWLLSPDGHKALRERGFHYNTLFGRVDLPQEERSIVAPTLVFSCRSAWRRLVSIYWTRFWMRVHRDAPVLRLAVHPCDLEHPAILKSVLCLLRRAVEDRQPITYRDLAPDLAQSLAPPR